jgi:hypothetical protein
MLSKKEKGFDLSLSVPIERDKDYNVSRRLMKNAY